MHVINLKALTGVTGGVDCVTNAFFTGVAVMSTELSWDSDNNVFLTKFSFSASSLFTFLLRLAFYTKKSKSLTRKKDLTELIYLLFSITKI